MPSVTDGLDNVGYDAGSADIQQTVAGVNTTNSLQSKDSYSVVIDNLPIKLFTRYAFTFRYLYENPMVGKTEPIPGPPSATYFVDYTPPNECTEPTNVVLTAGFGSYQVKWDKPDFNTYVDTIIYESPTTTFDTNSKVVYIGTANQCTVLTGIDYTPRYVKVFYRDKYLHTSPNGTMPASPVTPKNADPDTSTPASPPSGALAIGSIDANDKSGFGGQILVSWTANTDANTSGYVIRWSTDNPSSVAYPDWEYGQVEGKATTSFKMTGLLLNTIYYYQITAKSPYNAISWTAAPVQTLPAIVDSSAGGAWSRIKSYLSVGGATEDLFKFGTAIPASLNFSTTTTPSLNAGTYSGTILNVSTTNVGNNYWLNTGKFRVGSDTSFLYWDGSDLYTTGKINATGGSFTGDVKLNGGSLYAGASASSGARVRLNNAGIFAYNASGTQTFALDQATGLIAATEGSIAGWTLSATTLSKNNIILNSTGNIFVGSASSDMLRLSATDADYRLWVGNNTGSLAAFSVSKAGVLKATGATIDGTITITGGTTKTAIDNAASNASTALTTANAASATAGTASTTATNAANLAATKLTKSANTITDSSNNMTAINAGGITVYSGNQSSGARVVMNSAGIAGYNASNVATFSVESSTGNAIFKGDITGASGTFSGTLSSASNIASGGTLSGSNINIGGDTDSYSFKTSYIRTNGPNVSSLGINAIGMISLTSAGCITAWYPYYDATYDLGAVDTSTGVTRYFYWRNLRYTNSLIQQSDRRTKTDIETTDLGLDFINSLNPVKYRKLYNPQAPILGEDGQPLLDENGKRIVDETQKYEGSRSHYGFIAQEVKEALDESGVGDSFAGWVLTDENDPDSQQGLSYVAFISPLTKAVQELSSMVKLLQQEVNTLKGL